MRHVIFGESHGPAIGVVLEGVPAGLELDWDFISREMARRAPGKDPTATARREADVPRVLSGVFEGRATGTPLCAVIENTDTRSGDYARTKDLARPGHADYTGRVRYGGFNDYRGGGHFSGRLTAPLVFAGAVAKLILRRQGVLVGAHIKEIAGIRDAGDWTAGPVVVETLAALADKPFPVLDDGAGEAMRQAILTARSEKDSVGGKIECAVLGLPAGLGAPDYGYNVEGVFARQLFAVPGVKSVSFGIGEGFAALRGSQANDPMYMDGDTVRTRTNHTGGVNGGITSGMPVVCSVTMRPTPSIGLPQETVDMAAGADATLVVQGRHDPCIVPRAVPVIEAAAALAACQILGI